MVPLARIVGGVPPTYIGHGCESLENASSPPYTGRGVLVEYLLKCKGNHYATKSLLLKALEKYRGITNLTRNGLDRLCRFL